MAARVAEPIAAAHPKLAVSVAKHKIRTNRFITASNEGFNLKLNRLSNVSVVLFILCEPGAKESSKAG
jgi:hypothetical protein